MNEKSTVLILDHFDSFTYNLAQQLAEVGAEVRVVRTNERPRGAFTHLVLSPGPGHPDDVPLFQEALHRWAGVRPILGVCLGHQAICRFAGLDVVPATKLMHGKTSTVRHSGSWGGLLADVPNPFRAMRYHSFVVPEVRDGAYVTAWSDDDEVMAVTLRNYRNVHGVQFHPESFFTEGGERLLSNFLKMR